MLVRAKCTSRWRYDTDWPGLHQCEVCHNRTPGVIMLDDMDETASIASKQIAKYLLAKRFQIQLEYSRMVRHLIVNFQEGNLQCPRPASGSHSSWRLKS